LLFPLIGCVSFIYSHRRRSSSLPATKMRSYSFSPFYPFISVYVVVFSLILIQGQMVLNTESFTDFGQAKIGYGDLVLGQNQFLLLSIDSIQK
jgi:hypothetical protein